MNDPRGRHAAPPTALAAFKDARDAAQLAYQRELASTYDTYYGALSNAAAERDRRTQEARAACEDAIAAARAALDIAAMNEREAGRAGA